MTQGQDRGGRHGDTSMEKADGGGALNASMNGSLCYLRTLGTSLKESTLLVLAPANLGPQTCGWLPSLRKLEETLKQGLNRSRQF